MEPLSDPALADSGQVAQQTCQLVEESPQSAGLGLAPDAIVVPIEPVRVAASHLEVPEPDFAAVQIRSASDADGRIRPVTTPAASRRAASIKHPDHEEADQSQSEQTPGHAILPC